MATLEEAESNVTDQPVVGPRGLRWPQILAISIFWFALNFHWSALGTIILPSQVLKLVGDFNKGSALAFVLIPGAFVALFSNPLFGLLSDRTHGKLARWGRRRPYILVGTLVNIAALVWMAFSTDILSLMLAYVLVQFSSNAAQAPFHALLPDIVPAAQRGKVSGVMGLLQVGGNIGGVIVASLLVDASRPFTAYQQGLWLAYAIIMVILMALMLITISSVRERTTLVPSPATEDVQTHGGQPSAWRLSISRSTLLTICATVGTVLLVWGMMTLWNKLQPLSVTISGDVQQVILEIIATIGLLRMFDFRPRRDPDFAWVFVTRLLMMLGIYTIQTFLLYYMRDVVRVPHPEQQTTSFIIFVSLTSLVSAFAAGWLSDRFGRKRMVYLSGMLMALVGLIFVVTHSLPIVLASGAIFGLGYGAYQSVDWALVADVLPSQQHYARDMGVWYISLGLPQVIAPVVGGPLIDHFNQQGNPVLGFQLLFCIAIAYCVLGTVAVRYIRGVKK